MSRPSKAEPGINKITTQSKHMANWLLTQNHTVNKEKEIKDLRLRIHSIKTMTD